MPNIILVTSCSSTRLVKPVVRVADMPAGLQMKQAVEWWVEALKAHTAEMTPRELYRGLGFITLTKIQEAFPLKAVKIVTGGQGLIDLDEPIVPYDFTASPKESENIHQHVTAEPFVQTVWWKMINSLRDKGEYPVSQLLEDEDTVLLIALGKIFLRYISDDILTASFKSRPRIRILLAASSVGSVPAQLRPMIIPFDRECISHIPGNRNDSNHRAAYLFLEHWQKGGSSFQEATIEAQRRHFSTDAGLKESSERFDLRKILEERPYLLEMDTTAAYRILKKEFGTFGGRTYFRSVFREMTGETIEVDAEEVAAAAETLKNMSFISSPTARVVDSEEETIAALKVFVEAVRRVAPKAVFNTPDIVEWAKKHFTAANLPSMMSSANKLTAIVRSNAALIGIQEVDGSSGRGYALIPEEETE